MIGIFDRIVPARVDYNTPGIDQANRAAAVIKRDFRDRTVIDSALAGFKRPIRQAVNMRASIRYIIQFPAAQINVNRPEVLDLDEFIIVIDRAVVVPVEAGAREELVDDDVCKGCGRPGSWFFRGGRA